MTDNEIVKALEHCMNKDQKLRCTKCEYTTGCKSLLIREAFYIINRQKAEIERLEAMVDAAEEEFSPLPFKNNFDEYIEKCKAETIKEFAEKVKQSRNRLFNTIYSDYHFGEKIDQLVKEMTEDAE